MEFVGVTIFGMLGKVATNEITKIKDAQGFVAVLIMSVKEKE